MASVASLDKDLRKMRLDKYTPGAAREARDWIEETLGQRLPPGDLLDALKDGVALCRLVNLAVPSPGVKFKQSPMPFVQMENISHFLRACQQPPLSLQQHDMFLTVDLYESKDPAQVLQCLGAFSRAASAANPSVFPAAIGRPRGVLSPQSTGPGGGGAAARNRGMSNASNGSSAYGSAAGPGRRSPTKPSSPSISSWSRKDLEGATSPAWNITQYGYMGGASQGNLGISFGGRRQITADDPRVPSLAEKEKQRREQEERQRQQQEEEEEQRKAEREAEEERARLEEERRWEEETRKARAEDKRRAEEERRRWEEEELRWKRTEEQRRKEEQEAEARLAEERQRSRSKSDARLRGQFLSQYQSEQGNGPPQQQKLQKQRTGENGGGSGADEYRDRVRELEKELEEARRREEEYKLERQERTARSQPGASSPSKSRARSRSRAAAVPRSVSRQDSWSRNDEQQHQQQQQLRQQQSPREPPLPPRQGPPPAQRPQPALPARPLPDPTLSASVSAGNIPSPPSPGKIKAHRTGETAGFSSPPIKTHNTGGRPLPDPRAYASRTDHYVSQNPTAVQAAAQQQQTKPNGWASKSLFEREMERERALQLEWERAQRETAKATRPADGAVDGIGGGIGGRWDVGQWSGYTGGDGQNRGSQGIGANRRQIVGPRPLPGSSR